MSNQPHELDDLDSGVTTSILSETSPGFRVAMAITTAFIVALLLFVPGCKTTPEGIRAQADHINQKIDEEQARANEDIDNAEAIGKAAKDAGESVIDNVKESVKDVIDNAKDSAEAVKDE